MSQLSSIPLCGNTRHDSVRTTGRITNNASNNSNSKNERILKALMRFRHNSRAWMEDSRLGIEEILCRELYRCILTEDKHGFENVITIVNLQKFESTKWTPLMTCVQKQKFSFTKRLLQQGASVHSRDPNKRVVLHVACASGWTNIAKLLLTHKYGISNRSNVNVLDKSNNTPLFFACKSGHCELIKFILLNTHLHNQICNINIQNKFGQTALHIACEKGYYEIVRQLLNYKEIKCILNICDSKGHTPLFRAVRRHRYDIVTLLLKAINKAGKHRNCKKTSRIIISNNNNNNSNRNNCPKNGKNQKYLKTIKSPKRKKVKGYFTNGKNNNNNNNNSSNDDTNDVSSHSSTICKSPKYMRAKWLRYGLSGINTRHALLMNMNAFCKHNTTNNGKNNINVITISKRNCNVKNIKNGENRLLRHCCKNGATLAKLTAKEREIDTMGVNSVSFANGMTCIMLAAKTRDNKMLELLLFDKNLGAKHEFWLETTDKQHNVLYYLKKYKCDKKYYRHISQSLRLMIHCCLMSDCCNPPLPDAISELIASMTY